MVDDQCPDMSEIDALKATQKGQYRYGADADWGVLEGGTYLRNLANTIEPSMCGGDAALCQII